MFGIKFISERRFDQLREEVTAYSRALEDIGWININTPGQVQDQLLGEAFKKVLRLCKIYYFRNPLAGHWVDLTTAFVFGEGVSKPKAQDPKIQEIVDKFWDSQDNQMVMTSFIAQQKISNKIQYEGNVFFMLFVDDLGDVRVRILNTEDVEDIVYDPEDSARPIFYKVRDRKRKYDFGADAWNISLGDKFLYYADWKNSNPEDYNVPQDKFVKDVYIYHIKINCDINDKFGIPQLYRGIDWIRAHKDMAGDLATLIRSLSTLAWKKKVKGTPTQVTNLRAAMHAKLDMTNKSAAAGSTQYENEAIDTTPINTPTGGAVLAEKGLKQMTLMVCAASGLFYHYFGDPECYSEDTEVLTENGWMFHKDWHEGIKVACFNPGTKKVEFHLPYSLRIIHHDGEMIKFKNAQTDILVTPNHRMYTARISNWVRLPKLEESYSGRAGRKRISDGGASGVDTNWGILEAQGIETEKRTTGFRFLNSASFENEDIDILDTPMGMVPAELWAKFIGYWLSEGHIVKTRKGCIGISQNEGAILQSMRQVLSSMGLKWHETKNQSGCIQLNIYHRKLYDYLDRECGAGCRDKRIPKEFFSLGMNAKMHLYQSMMEGDGGKSGRSYRYSTVSKNLADDFQILCMAIGYAASITQEYSIKGGIYRVWIRTQWIDTEILPEHISREKYTGNVYCFHLPHHIYVTRRNGKTAIQGNTGNLATTKNMELPMIKKFTAFQSLWIDIYDSIFQFMIDRKIEKGLLPGQAEYDTKFNRVTYVTDIDRNIDIDFPPIIEEDLKPLAEALEIAKRNNLIGDETAARIYLLASQVNNVDDEIGEIDFTKQPPSPFGSFGAMPTNQSSAKKEEQPQQPPVKESIDTPGGKTAAMKHAGKTNHVLQRMNGYRKALAGNFTDMKNAVVAASKTSGEKGQIVGNVVGLKDILGKFKAGMLNSANVYFPIAIDIGKKYTQSHIKDTQVKESLFEANGRQKSLIKEKTDWNEKYVAESLIPDIETRISDAMRVPYGTEAEFAKAISDAVDSFESRIEQYVGGFWSVEEAAVKEAGLGTGLMVNFGGADDNATCDGCLEAMNGNPYPIDEAPEPGSHECDGRCRHALQIIE